jgi:hypothetical protein
VMHTVENLEPGTGYIFKVLKTQFISGDQIRSTRQSGGCFMGRYQCSCGRAAPLRPTVSHPRLMLMDPSFVPLLQSPDPCAELRGPQ